jgi:hypothetical protein
MMRLRGRLIAKDERSMSFKLVPECRGELPAVVKVQSVRLGAVVTSELMEWILEHGEAALLNKQFDFEADAFSSKYQGKKYTRLTMREMHMVMSEYM